MKQTLIVKDLLCEYLVNPLGVDVANPRLSWKVESAQRSQKQIAYRILVASNKENLNANKGDLWDTGKIESDKTAHIAYEGKTLTSRMKCYWKVMVWNVNNIASEWSGSARWSMGLLEPSDWRGDWLGTPAHKSKDIDPKQALTFDDCHWIWFPEVTESYPGDRNPSAYISPCTRYFRRTFTLDQNAKVRWAGVLWVAYDELTLYINDKQVGGQSEFSDSGYVEEVTKFLVPGKNVLAIEATKISTGLAGIVGKLIIQLENGNDITITTDGSRGYWWGLSVRGENIPSSWKTSKVMVPGWTEADFNDADWLKAQSLVSVDHAAERILPGWRQMNPIPIFRKRFEVKKSIKSATVYICGLGYYELRLNGDKVGDHVLDPAFTVYNKHVLYVTYDVTDQLKQGSNALGVMLGNGWYNMHTRTYWGFENEPWRDRPKMLLQLHIEFTDGTTEVIASDSSWRRTVGPVLLDSVHNGEVYDARREIPGWDKPGFDDSAWQEPELVAAPNGALKSQMMPAIKVVETITPIEITEPKPGVFIFDMGQNFAGWAKLKVSGGPAGTKITMRYGERLLADGTLDRKGLNDFILQGPFQTSVYIMKGCDTEVWEPRFTYHGFRYIEVTGLPTKPTVENLIGQVAHTSFDKAGSFECSNEMLNKIQHMMLWSYRSNFFGYQTDCPHREKNGWAGDSHIIAETALYNFKNAAAYKKWMNDFRDAQLENGKLPNFAPPCQWAYERDAGPTWDCTYILIPWYLYLYYGDTGILTEHYKGMKRLIEYLRSRSKKNIISYGSDDWNTAKTVTPVPVTSTASYYISVLTVSKIAGIMGKTHEMEEYAKLAADIRKSFNRHFYKGNGLYANGSQAALSCALYYDLVDKEEKQYVLKQLVKSIQRENWHLDVGIFGIKWLLFALTENGESDIAYRIATQTTPPSYGYWLECGATTMWENWYGDATLFGSLNHYSFGSIGAWFYKALAGINIDPERPGFKHIIIRPWPVGDLTWAQAEHESMYGMIASSWRIADGKFSLDVTIPTNTTATVYVPTENPDSVQEGGVPASKAEAVQLLRIEDSNVLFEVDSGRYRFVSKL